LYESVDVPEAMPVTIPVAIPTWAAGRLLLLHVPPVVALVSKVVVPAHTLGDPLIAAGDAFTVTTWVLIQPVPTVYDIVTVPGAMPVTIAVVGVTVAMPVAPDDHTPPPVELSSAVVFPWHTTATPPIAVGNGFTVTGLVTKHPLLRVYCTVAVPGPAADTTPDVTSTLATKVLLLDHVPPKVALASVVVVLGQRDGMPVMAAGN
jgi:hypothetical protein